MTLVIIVGVKISIFHLFTLRRTHILGTGILYFSTVHLNVKKRYHKRIFLRHVKGLYIELLEIKKSHVIDNHKQGAHAFLDSQNKTFIRPL